MRLLAAHDEPGPDRFGDRDATGETGVQAECPQPAGGVGPDRDPRAAPLDIGNLGQGVVEDADVVGGGVQPSPAFPQLPGERPADVVQEADQRGSSRRSFSRYGPRIPPPSDTARWRRPDRRPDPGSADRPWWSAADRGGSRTAVPGPVPAPAPERRGAWRGSDRTVSATPWGPRRPAGTAATIAEYGQVPDRLTTVWRASPPGSTATRPGSCTPRRCRNPAGHHCTAPVSPVASATRGAERPA